MLRITGSARSGSSSLTTTDLMHEVHKSIVSTPTYHGRIISLNVIIFKQNHVI